MFLRKGTHTSRLESRGLARRVSGSKVLLSLAIFSAAIAALASDDYSGSVNGVFTNEGTSGWIIGLDGTPLWVTDTAPYILGDGTNDLIAGQPGPGYNSDQWVFVGSSFTDVKPGQAFLLGQLSYFNGTCYQGTDVFLGDLDLSLNLAEGSAVDPLTIQYDHISTQNNDQGTQAQNADWLNFNQIDASFHVYEGDWATVDVYGMIIGDPYMGDLVLQPVLDGNGNFNGWVGPSQPVMPGPAAVLPFAAGLIGCIRRKRRV